MIDFPVTPKAEYWQMAKEAVGVMKAQQRPEEFAMALTLVAEQEPKVMLEIGCADGGTLYCWSQIVPEVYGITLWSLENESRDWHGADVLLSDSRALGAHEWIIEKLAGRELDVLFIDGEHTYDTAKSDFENFAPLVRKGGLVLMHDVAAHRKWWPGLKQYWAELAESRNGYIISDTDREELMIGFGVINV